MKLTNAQSCLEFDCQDTLEIMDLYVICSDELTIGERNDAAEHIFACESCRKEYLQMTLTDTLLRVNRHWLVGQGVLGQSETSEAQVKMADKEISELRFKAMMDRALIRRKRREPRERIAKNKKVIRSIFAVAACLIIVCSICGIFANNNSREKSRQQILAVKSAENKVKIQLLTGQGNEIIKVDQPVTVSSGLKTLRINGNRHMILNTGTELSIVPHNLGCIVKLDNGEIYTEVEHDGKPFIVETTHGRAVITGTAFNIRADDKEMELVVTKGTVSFEGDKGKVNVTSGHKSLLVSNARPTLPVQCDTVKLTAWATGLDNPQKAAANVYQSEIILNPVFERKIDLEKIDCGVWIEQKRFWFKREFPHIFKFKAALVKEGIEVDYPELLIKSGDLWRFGNPERTSTRLIPANYKCIIKLACIYDKDVQWLNDNLHISSSALTSENGTTTLEAFNRWRRAVEDVLKSPSQLSGDFLTSALHASVYLVETRTLAWVAVQNGQINPVNGDKDTLSDLLEKEIDSAHNCVTQIKRLFFEDHDRSKCGESEQVKLLKALIDNINVMTEIEKEMGYVIHK